MAEKKTEKKAQTPLHALGGSPPARSAEQRWVLASQGILTELYNANHLRMGGMPRPLCANFGALFLRRDWGVKSRAGAIACIESLLEEGHRHAFAESLGCDPQEICAWDYVRASAVAGWAYLAYHLEADEAWRFMVEAARKLSESYGSWREVADAYLRARVLWSSGGEAELGPKIAKLLAPGGGWDFPWAIDLSGEIPPAVEPLDERIVDKAGGEGVFTTIKAAMSAVVAADRCARITVRAGHYPESVTIRFPVELVADGAVTIESHEGAPIVSHKQNALLRGLTLVSGKSEEGEAMQGVFHEGFHLKLEACTIRSARCGVYALTKNAFLVMEKCTIESAAASGIL
ncbi:MAG: DUF1266 domain-containing protein, partial [Myxococcales bacterium]|nr:DUF1266 domain-containing protein [Myxococcales bacterium]